MEYVLLWLLLYIAAVVTWISYDVFTKLASIENAMKKIAYKPGDYRR